MKIFKRTLIIVAIVLIVINLALYIYLNYVSRFYNSIPPLPENYSWHSTEYDINVNTYDTLYPVGYMIIDNVKFKIEMRRLASCATFDIIYEDENTFDNREIILLYADYKYDNDGNVILYDISYNEEFDWGDKPTTIILERQE